MGHPVAIGGVPLKTMATTDVRSLTPTHHLVKGAIAGLVGGLVATAAKTAAEKLYPPRTHGEADPTHVAAEKLGAGTLPTTEKKVASESIHWAFGALTGAAYGVMAELYPAVTAKNGVTFGMALMAFAHEGALPSLGLSAPPSEQEPREQRSEMVTHVVYGVVTETVRAIVRKVI